jgi:hypothetical protein
MQPARRADWKVGVTPAGQPLNRAETNVYSRRARWFFVERQKSQRLNSSPETFEPSPCSHSLVCDESNGIRWGSNERRKNTPLFTRDNLTGRQKKSQSPTNQTTTRLPMPFLPIMKVLAALF